LASTRRSKSWTTSRRTTRPARSSRFSSRQLTRPDLSRALAIDLNVDRFEYYTNRLNLPTLLARYHAPSDRLFARWAHNFDVSPRFEQKTITLRLTTDDLVDDASPAAWLEDMVVIVDPKRIEIQPVPWAGPNWRAEYGLAFRNTSARVVYDVHFDVRLERDSPLRLDRFQLEPQFPVDPSFGLSPIALDGCTRKAAKLSGSTRSRGWSHELIIGSGAPISLNRAS
jgi:hypothetical protein